MVQINLLGDNKNTKYITCPCCYRTGKELYPALGGLTNRECHCCKGQKKIKND